ncbi:MAG: hypothetical protein LBJ59_02690 [Zoogloeaceae bacterium]|jgi:hypothetical protein|nr:hypothetical protein [Zoogloeaceae bacterium]
MIAIPLQAIPNQAVEVFLDEAWFKIEVKTLNNGAAVVSIARDDVILVSGQRALPLQPLLPYRYLEGEAGNFAFLTDADDYPDYRRFGSGQQLVYATAAELAELRNAPAD